MRDALGWKWSRGRIVFLSPVFCVLLLVAGCSSTLQAKKSPGTDLSQLKAFYVQKLPADGRGIEQVIADRLMQMGYRAVSGPEDSPFSPVDAIVTYQDRWMWDITMYMIELSIQLREPQTRTVLATGHSMRTSLIRKSPEGMVEEVLTEIFKGGHP